MPATITVIAGPMFSYKTKELMRLIERSEIAHKRILTIRPIQDTRIERSLPAIPITNATDLFYLLEKERPDLLVIDEAQFFEPWIVDALMTIRDKQDGPNIQIIVAGLDMDYRRQPFGSMPHLMAIAATVEKLTGICMRCGSEEGAYTQAIHPMTSNIQIGSQEMYEVRCRACHTIP